MFRRKLTQKYIEKHFPISWNSLYYARYIGPLDDDGYDELGIEMREDGKFCLVRGYGISSYWVCNLKYVYQLKQMLRIFNIPKSPKYKRQYNG